MTQDIPPEILSFIKRFLPTVKIKNVDYHDLRLSTSLDLDLNLFDIDIDLFLTEFCEEFNIDYSEFKWPNGHYPQDPPIIVALIRTIFDYKKDWVKKKARAYYQPKIFIRDLVASLETGKLHLLSAETESTN